MDIHGTDVEQIRKIAEGAGHELLAQRNGYRGRRWDTRVGSIGLQIPKLRQGSYYPGWLLEPRTRSEMARSLDEHVEAFRRRDLSEHAYPYL